MSAPASEQASTARDPAEAWIERTVSQGRSTVHRLKRSRPEASAAASEPGPGATETATSAVHLWWPLVLVLVVIAGLVFAARRWLPRSHRFGGGVITVLARHYLSPKQSLCLVRLGQRVLLVGITPDRISPVAEISDAAEASAVISAVERGRPGSFTSILSRSADRDPEEDLTQQPIEDRIDIAPRQLAVTGANLRNLIGRIRSLAVPPAGTSVTGASAEPT